MSGHSMEGLTNCPVACLTPFNCCKTLSTLRRVADLMQGSRFAESWPLAFAAVSSTPPFVVSRTVQ